MEALARESFDLVLMDMQMPEMDGLAATAAIRARESETGGHVPILAMTAHAMKGDRERCLAAGMDGYLSKPLRAQELIDAVESIRPAEVAAPAASDTALFQPEAALERVEGDRDLLVEVIGLFLAEWPQTASDLAATLESGELPAVVRLAHTLKGAVGNFASPAAFQVAEALEHAARAGDLAAARAAFSRLQETMNRLVPALADYRHQHLS